MPDHGRTFFGIEAELVLRAVGGIGGGIELHGDLVGFLAGGLIDGEFLGGVGVVDGLALGAGDELHIVDGLFGAVVDIENDHGVRELGTDPLDDLFGPVAVVDAGEGEGLCCLREEGDGEHCECSGQNRECGDESFAGQHGEVLSG